MLSNNQKDFNNHFSSSSFDFNPENSQNFDILESHVPKKASKFEDFDDSFDPLFHGFGNFNMSEDF
jgi:hypothetical protein